MQFISALSRLTAILVAALINSTRDGLADAHGALESFRNLASRVENDWAASQLSVAEKDGDIGAFN